MWNIHALIDNLSTSLGSRFMPKYFREGFESPTIREHLEAIRLEMPEIKGEGHYEVGADTLAGKLGPAFRLTQWKGKSFPAIIYHHGASEIPFDYGFKRIFPHEKMEIGANLFLIRAPFHISLKEFQQGLVSLVNVVAMLAVSVCLMEKLVNYCREEKTPQVLIAGTSMGGFITNLHHIHFNTADIYTPLLAGLAMDDAYLYSAYSKAVAPEAKENPDSIKRVLNFEKDFAEVDHSNVYPLLARFDQLIRYDEQKASYGGCPVETIDKGHTTGALSYRQLRQHVMKKLK